MRNGCFTGKTGLQVGLALNGVFRLLSAMHADMILCFLKAHTFSVSHFKPRWRWVRDGPQCWWKAHCYQWMNQFFVFVCMCMSTFVRIFGTSVQYITSDLYSPDVTRDQLCWLVLTQIPHPKQNIWDISAIFLQFPVHLYPSKVMIWWFLLSINENVT